MPTSPQQQESYSEVDFSALVLGFSSAALYYIGHSAIEGKEPAQKNLPLAKQNIDILALLRTKTQGNLTGDEDKLLSEVLLDLKAKYQTAASE